MRKHRSYRIVPAALAFILAGQALASPSVADRPGCQGALGEQTFKACRLKTDTGSFDRSTSTWQFAGKPAESVSFDVHGNSKAFTVRALTPLGTTYRGGEITYDVQFNAGLYPNNTHQPGALSEVTILLWLGSDDLKHMVRIGSKKVTLGGDAIGPVRISVPGHDIGFDPNYVYAQIRGVDDLGEFLDGITPSRMIVQDLNIGIHPTPVR